MTIRTDEPSPTTRAAGPLATSAEPLASEPPRIVIQYPAPVVDGGAYPIKRCVGDVVEVSADVFRDGHELLRAVVRHTDPDGGSGEAELRRIDARLGGVRWAGRFTVDRPGLWEYTVEAWTDRFGTWRDELRRKLRADQSDLSGELSEGVVLLRQAAQHSTDATDRQLIEHAIAELTDPTVPDSAKHDAALGDELAAAIERDPIRVDGTSLQPPLRAHVDRLRARFGSWYELFPRSWGGFAGVQGAAAEARRARLRRALPDADPSDRADSPQGARQHARRQPRRPRAHRTRSAIGPAAIRRSTPSWARGRPARPDRRRQRARDRRRAGLGPERSADHPWLTEHPEWFQRRPDGTLKYAENPPKRYQDIYNFDLSSADWRSLWEAQLAAILFWVELRRDRVPGRQPTHQAVRLLEWLIERVHSSHPDVIFLAEAFTKRSVMRHLAKLGFTQSYTYFTWKNSRWELTEYVSELAYSGEQDYFRPNFFANTPDILHEYLQHGGPPAFQARLALAATLSPSYGIYSGFEHFENVPVRAGSEEYLHSEKYERKTRALDGPLLRMIGQINAIRRSHPALQELSNITFLETANDALIAYCKRTGDDALICVVSIDPHQPQEGSVLIPEALGTPPSFTAHDLLSGESYQWRIGSNFVRLAPGGARHTSSRCSG